MSGPLNTEASSGRNSEGTNARCWNKVIDFAEAKFAGHLGDVELAGSTLANSWATTGLSGALETLCGQCFGAKMYKMLGIYLQTPCIISLFFSIVISIWWFFTKPIFVLLHQDPEISRMAALYMKFLIPGLFAYGFLQNILRFIQTQSIVIPFVLFSAIPFGIHFGIVHGLVNKTSLGVRGAAMAASISIWLSFLSLAMYVVFANKFKNTWKGSSLESFHYIVSNSKLAIPSAAMVCLEFWAFEILVFLAGLMPNSEITTSLIAICVTTESIAYVITYGLSAAVSCSHKQSMRVSLMLSVLLALLVVLTLALGHDIWTGFFSDSYSIIKKFAQLTPLLAVSITIDAILGVLSGVARGAGWQNSTVLANLGTFYFIGLPIAVLLGFKFKLYVKRNLQRNLEFVAFYACIVITSQSSSRLMN
ncbi:hypothetical protein V6N13_012083 [Hibiscus sabdariffa]